MEQKSFWPDKKMSLLITASVILLVYAAAAVSGSLVSVNVFRAGTYGQRNITNQSQPYVSDMYNARTISSNTPYTFVNGRKTFLLGTQPYVNFNGIVSPCDSQYGSGTVYTPGIYNCQPSFSSGDTDVQAQSQATAKAATSVESTNWAGWVSTSSTPVATSVAGSWVVQAAEPTSTSTYSSQWIGIGGFSDQTLVQTGTESDYYDGSAHYDAWYELLPADETPINGSFSVSPGDVISANITKGSAPDTWVITLTDITKSEAFTITVTYDSSQLSSEWIEERPEICSRTCTLTSLASFGTAYYGQDNTGVIGTNYASMGSGSHQISALPGLTSVTMVSSAGSSTTLAEPSALTPDGTSFTVAGPSSSTTTTTAPTTSSSTTSTSIVTTSTTSSVSTTSSTPTTTPTMSTSRTTTARSTTSKTTSTSTSRTTSVRSTTSSATTARYVPVTICQPHFCAM